MRFASAIGLLSLGLAFCLPFVAFPEKAGLVPSTYSEAISVALFGGSAIAFAFVLPNRTAALSPLLAGALLALVGPAAWHWVNGTSASPYFAYTLVTAALLLCFAFQFGRMIAGAGLTDRVVSWVAAGVLAGSLITVSLQVLQGTGLAQALPGWVAGVSTLSCGMYGNLAQINHTATYLAVGSLGALYLLNRGVLKLTSFTVTQFVLMSAIGLTGSRMGLLAIGFVTAVASLPQNRRVEMRGRTIRPGWFVAAAAVCGVLFAFWLGSNLASPCASSLHRAIDEAGTVARSNNFRLELLRRSVEAVSAQPWSGIGPGNFAGFTYQAANPANGNLLDYYAHNLFAQVGAELGLPAAILLAALIASWLWASRRGWLADATFYFTGGVVVLLLLHSLIEYPLWYVYFLLPFGLLAGLGTSQWPIATGSAVSPSLLRVLGIAMVVGAAAIYVDYSKQVKAWNIVRSLVDQQRHASFEEIIDFQRAAAGTYFRPYSELNELRLQDFSPIRTGDREILNSRLIKIFPEQDVMAREIELTIRDRNRAAAAFHVQRVRLFKRREAEQLFADVRDTLTDDRGGVALFDQVLREVP